MNNDDNTQIGDESWDDDAPVPEEADSQRTPYASKKRIDELNPTPELERGFYSSNGGLGYENLSKIQGMILPDIVKPPHKNVIFYSPIGSGKSTALVIAISFRVDQELEFPQAICIVPNGVLAKQNKEWLLKMRKNCPITCALGIMWEPRVEAQVIIGTPVTIQEWIEAEELTTHRIKMFLIDDVDHVLAKPGFKDSVLRIMKDISKKSPQCQVIMCCNDLNAVVKAFVSEIEQVLSQMTSLDNVKQYKVNAPYEHSKIDIIKDKILSLRTKVGQTIIFVHTKERASMLLEALEADSHKFNVKPLDDADTQEQRDRIFNEFEEKRFEVLISTIIPDRMFDQSQVDLVVFCDLSIISVSSLEPGLEKYSHFIGRAGQFGRKGAVFNLMCGEADKMIMEKIEMQNNVTEVLWSSDVEFEGALTKAGLCEPRFGIS